MDYEVLSIPPPGPDVKVQKHNLAVVLIYCCCLGLAGFIFAIGCFILFICGLVLDLLSFIGLLGMALGSLVWGRVKRVEGRVVVRSVAGYFKNPVWK